MEGTETKERVIFVPKNKQYNSIEHEDLTALIATIKNQSETIKFISLRGNSYSKDFCIEFAKLLPNLKNLEGLDLSDSFVSRGKTEIPEALEAITQSLVGLEKFTKLDISNNAISVAGCKAISYYLERAQNLKVLHMGNGGIGIDGSTIVMKALQKGNVKLEVVSIARNRLENAGAKAMAEFLKENPAIREVHTFQNVIRKDGMVPLLDALADKKIEVLDISDNFIAEESVDKFCDFLQINETIRTLNVSDCNIDLKGSTKIVEALEKSKAILEKVGYNRNELRETKSAQQFLDTLLVKNPKMIRLDIVGNEFNKTTKEYYKTKAVGVQFLSVFESDEEDEEDNKEKEDDLVKAFGNLKIT